MERVSGVTMYEREIRKSDLQHQEARYANYFEVGFNMEEVVLNLGQGYEDSSTVSVHTRIVTSPAYAKYLADLLQQTIVEYEAAHGPIPPNRKSWTVAEKPPGKEEQ